MTVRVGRCGLRCRQGIFNDLEKIFAAYSRLDDPSLFAPTKVINRDDAAPWHKKAAALILHDEVA
jgi:hypothetical protein